MVFTFWSFPWFYNNKINIVCAAFKVIDLKCISCVHVFKVLVTFWCISFLSSQLVTYKDPFSGRLSSHKLCWGHEKSPSLFPHLNDKIWDNSLFTSTLLDKLAGWLNEIGATFISLIQYHMCSLRAWFGAEGTVSVNWRSILIQLQSVCFTICRIIDIMNRKTLRCIHWLEDVFRD